MPNLPFELIEDILRRLPVKSLKRFRCVAKSWCFMIDSECFVKSHLLRSLTLNFNRHLILGGLGLYSVDLDSPGKVHVIKPPFYYKSVDGISSSCNGLVLVISEPPVLWNPFSTEYKVLPKTCVGYPSVLGAYSKTAYGFCYDSRDDDYKVVRVVEFRDKETHVWMSSRTEIYSLKSNCWRHIEPFPYALPFLKGNWSVHVNGLLYMLMEDPDETTIMAFSVESEKHYEKKMPPGIQTRGMNMSLDALGGCLSLICASKSRVTIWVMKDCGLKECWTKLLSISPPEIEPHDFVKPLVYSADGRKVMLNCGEKRLVWYDLEKKTVQNVCVDGLPFVFYAELCVESLVSLGGPYGVKKQGHEKKMERRIRNKRDVFLSEGFKLVL